MNRFDESAALVAVVEHGSFSAAAERLAIAKSAVSRRVTDLEARLRVRLLNRTTRRLNLTEPGRVLHKRAVRLLADWDETEQMVSAEGAQPSGPLKVSTPLSFGLRYLGAVVAEFARAHPDVQLEVDLSDREMDLSDREMDLSDREVDLVDQGFDLAQAVSHRPIAFRQLQRKFTIEAFHRPFVDAYPHHIQSIGIRHSLPYLFVERLLGPGRQKTQARISQPSDPLHPQSFRLVQRQV